MFELRTHEDLFLTNIIVPCSNTENTTSNDYVMRVVQIPISGRVFSCSAYSVFLIRILVMLIL